MNQYAIPALKRKRAELAGKVQSLKKEIGRINKELASIDATIRLFDPEYRIGSLKPIRTKQRSKLFKLGELGRLIVDALRRANGGPLTTADITAAVTAAIGEKASKAPVLAHSVRSNLDYLARRGRVVKMGERMSRRWRLA